MAYAKGRPTSHSRASSQAAMDVQLEDLLHDFPDDILKSGDKPWTVHDGQMFASHVWSQKARAPNERCSNRRSSSARGWTAARISWTA